MVLVLIRATRRSAYKAHVFETPTGLRFLMLTDPSVGDVRDDLKQVRGRVGARRPVAAAPTASADAPRQLYAAVYVEYVVKSAVGRPDEPIQSKLFAAKLDAFMQSLPYFRHV